MKNFLTLSIFISVFLLPATELFSQCSVTAGADFSVCQNAAHPITATAAGGTVTSYAWTTIPPTGSTPGNPFNVPTGSSGTFTYVVTANFTGGCTATDTVVVTVNPAPTNPAITANPNTSQCSPATINFSTPAQAGVTFSWAYGDAGTGSGSSVSHTYAGAVGNGSNNYTVTATATNGFGCSATATHVVTVKQHPDAVLSDPITNFRFCGVGGNGTITVYDASTPSSNSNYTINWGDGSGNYSSSTAPSGVAHTYGQGVYTITYTVTGTNGCTDVTTYNVYNISNPQVGAGNPGNTQGCGPRTVCFPINTFSSNDASTTYSVTFGDGSPTQYYTHPPPDTICHTYTVTSCGQPGNAYTFQIKAGNGCDTSYAIIYPVRIYIQPAPDFTITATPGCVNTPTVFTNHSMNGYNISCDTAALYTWNFGDGSANVVTTNKGPQTHTYTTPGLYIVTLSAQNSCGTGIDSIPVCVQSPPTPSFTASIATGCAPLAVTMNNTSTGQNQCGVLTRTWTITKTGSTCTADSASDYVFISGTNSSSPNPVIQFNNQGTYNITLTLTNSCGTFVTSAQTITVKRRPQITLTVPPTICQGQTISPTVSSLPCGGTISSYSWSFPGGSPSSSTLQNPGAITYTTSGNHTVSVTVTNECGTTSASGTVNVLPPPTANAGPDAQFCSGGNAVLGGAPTGGLTYSWTPGTGLSSATVSNPTVTLTNNGTTPTTYTYILTVTNAASCTAKDTVLVTVYPPPTVNAGPDQAVCTGAGQSINLSGSIGGSATTATWSSNNGGTFGNVNSLNTTYTPSISSGTVTITLTTDDPTGPCPAASDNLTLTVVAPPVANAGADVNFCSGGSATIGSAFQFGNTYSWSPTTGLNLGTSANPTVTLTNNGTTPVTYTYILTMTNTASGCFDKDTVLVTVYPPATVNAGAPQTVCAGGTVTLSGSFGGSATSATWSSSSGTFSNVNSLTSTFTPTISSGTAVVTLTTDNPAGPCPASTATVIITVNAIPVVTLPGNQTVCSGSATTAVTFTSSVGGTTYTWSGSSPNGVTGFPASGSTSNIPSFTPTNPNTTAGTITYSITPTANGCPGNPVSYTYTVNPRPNVTVPAPQTICSGGTTTAVSFTSNVAGATFSWTATASGVTGYTASGNGNIPAQTLTNSGTTTGTVTYTVTPTASGCAGTPATYVITVYPNPNVTLPAAQSICSGGTTTAVTLNSSVAGTTFSWSASSATITGYTPSGTGNIPAQTLTNLGTTPGTVVYSITPTANGCPGTPQNYIITVNPIPVATATPGSATICSGTQTNIGLTSNVAGTTFSWTVSAPGSITGASNGSSSTISQTLTSSSTTPQNVTYTITPTANGCPGTPISVTITVNPGAIVTFSPAPQSLCSGQTSVPVVLSSTTNGATFTWTSQANGAGGVAASGTDTIPAQTLTNSTNVNISVVYSAVASFSGCNSPAATYTITVKPIPSVTQPTNQTVCSGAATTLVTFTSTVAGTTYSWSGSSPNGVTGFPANGTSSNIPSFTPTNSSTTAGTIDYTVTPTASGCPGSPVTFTYTVNPRPDVIVPAPQAICSGTSTTAVSFTSGVSGTTFGWTATASGVTGYTASGSGNIPSQTLTNSGTTNGTVTYTITPTASGCAGTPGSYVITVYPNPNVIPVPAQTICSGATTTAVILSSSVSGTTFSWSATSGSITGFTPSGTGNIPAETLTNPGNAADNVVYAITPTANGCPGTPRNFTVTVNPIPIASANPDTSTICTATQTNISLSSNVGGTTFTWTVSAPASVTGASNGSGSSIQQTLTNSSGVSQQVTYTVTPSANGCPGAPIIVVVFVHQSAAISFSPGPQTLCSGQTSQTVYLSSTGGATFSWTSQANGAGGVATSGTDSIPPQTLTNTTNAPIQVVYSATASFSGCGIPSNNYTITVNPIPAAILPANQTLCSGVSTAPVNITSPVAGTTFLWSGNSPDGVTGFPASDSTSTIPSFLPNNPNITTGTINYTITPSANNCPGSPVPYLFTISPEPVADPIPPQTICSNQTTTAVTPTANVVGTTFNWSSGVSGAITGNTASGSGTIPAETLVNSGTTIGTVTYTITPTVNGCSGSPVNFVVTVNPIPNVIVPAPQTICSGQSTTPVNITSNVSGTTFSWTAAASSGNISGYTANGTGNIPSETISNSGTTIETVTYTITPDASTCIGSPQNYVVTVNPIPVASVTPAFDTICPGTQTNISISANVTGTTFSWTASAPVGVSGYSNGTGNQIQQTLTNTNPNLQSVTYTITPSANSCPGADVTAEVTVGPGVTIQFTPAPQTICSGNNTQQVIISSPTAGVVFSWTSLSSGLSGVAASGADTIPVQTLVNNTYATATATYTATAVYGACSGLTATYDITVLPTPDVVLPPSQSICSGTSTSPVNLNSNVSGTAFTWTGSTPDGITGFTTSGTSTIPGEVLMNPSAVSSGTVIYVITPFAAGCPGPPVNYVVTVSPRPDVNIPAPQAICSGVTSAAVTLTSSLTGTTFSWVATAGANISGFTSSGSGDIPAQTISNTGATIDSVVFAVTPNSGGCSGAFVNYVITVFPVPDIILPAPQTICSGASTTPVTLNSNVNGTTFVWTATAPANVTGYTASGTNTIAAQTIFNSGTISGVVTYTITPTANSCDGPPQDYLVTVNPDVVISVTPSADTICANTQTYFSLSSNVAGTIFSWTVNAPASVTGASNGTGNVIQQTLTNSSQSQQTVVYTITPNANACNGQPITVSAVVNPVVDIQFSSPPQTICSGETTTQVDIASSTPGVNFTWTSQSNGVVGVAASGTNTIPAQTLTNNSNVPITVTYSVTSDFGGCAGLGNSFSVLVNPTPHVILPADQAVCSWASTTAVLLTSDVAGATFTWSGVSPNGVTNFTPNGNTSTIPSQTPINPNLATGTVIYTVTASANNCPGPPSDYVITVSPAPDIILPAPQTICNGSTSNPVSITSTVSGATFTWTSSTNNITGNTPSGTGDIPAQTLSNTTPFVDSVVYTISVIASGCDGPPATYIIYVNPTPTVSIANAPQVICSGEPSQEVVISSVTPNVNIVWTANIPAGVTGALASGTGNIPSQVFNDTTLSTITYTIQANTIGTVCPGVPSQYQITVKPIPQIDFLVSLNGGCSPFMADVVPFTTNFGIPDTLIFNWGDGSPGVTTYASPQPPYWNTLHHLYYNTDSVPHTFNISMSGSNQCLDTTMVHPITVLPNIVNAFFIPTPTTGCEPLTVSFTDHSTGAATLSWCFDYDFSTGICNGPSVVNVPGSTVTHTFSAGTYTVALYINNGFGCAHDTAYQIIRVAPAPVADFTTPNILCGESTINFINQSTPAAGSFLTAFSWQFGDGDSSNLNSPQHFYSASGNYNVCLKATSSDGCIDTTCKPVSILDKPDVDFTFKDTCANTQPIAFTNNSTVATFYQWDFGDGNTSSLINPSNNYLGAGTYTVTLIGTTNTCSDTALHTVIVYPVPQVAFSMPGYSCGTPSDIQLTNNSSGATGYAWDFGNGTSSTAVNPVAVYSVPGNYTVNLIAANQFNCYDSAQNSIDIYPLPVIDAVDVNAEGCQPLVITVNANTTNGNIFIWNFGDGTSPVTFNTPTADYTYRDTGTYSISLLVYSSSTCADSVLLQDTVKVHIRAIADFDYRMNITDYPANGTVAFTNLSQHADSYLWDFGDGFESYEENPSHLYESLGRFTTTLIANNQWDCPDTVSKSFDVFKKSLYVPNAFAPDWGGSNELVRVWQPVGIGIKEYHAEIFNTWGELLWQSTKLTETKPAEAWDGTYKGKLCQQDVYVWKVNAVFLDGTLWEGMSYEPYRRKKTIGDVTLIR